MNLWDKVTISEYSSIASLKAGLRTCIESKIHRQMQRLIIMKLYLLVKGSTVCTEAPHAGAVSCCRKERLLWRCTL